MLLPMGRLADIYGGHLVFVGGLLWFSLWALITGFSKNYTMLIICRAMQGLGPAAYLPGGVMLMGKLYPPGQRKNLIFALYGAFGPLGFFSGILAGGLTVEYLSWPWYFWVGAVMLGIISGVSILAVPFDYRDRCRGDTMDWLGTATIVPGLVMVSYALTDSPHTGDSWFTAYIVIIGMLLLMSAWYVETRRAASPLLPSTLFAPKYIKPLLLANFMSFGSFGLFLFYSSLYIELVLHKSPLTTAMWYIPMIVGGLAIGVVGGFTLHFLPGRVLLVISSLANTVCMLLFALMPEGANYWAWVFPAMVCATVGVDVTFTVSNVFITTNIPTHIQGLAGALINSVFFLSVSFFLGTANIIVAKTADLGLRESYRAAFWLSFGVALVSFLISPFLKIGSAKGS